MLKPHNVGAKVSVMSDVLTVMSVTLLLQLSVQFWQLSSKQTHAVEFIFMDWFFFGAIASICSAFYIVYWFIVVSDRLARVKAWYMVGCVLSVPALFTLLN
jgi:hypothetical protein